MSRAGAAATDTVPPPHEDPTMTITSRPLTRALCAALLAASALPATETENLCGSLKDPASDLRILPAPGAMSIDAEIGDWDLSGGIFACGDVENQRDKYGVWIHAMWDVDNLYVLARWQDLTPLNHPGSIKGDYGFNGDCLQVRVLTAPAAELAAVANPDPADARDHNDPPHARTSHITAWRDRDHLDTINVAWDRRFTETPFEGKDKGARQAFKEWPDHRGYTQELAIPWTLLGRDGWKPAAGGRICMTIEPNFLTSSGNRLTIKDVLRAGVGIDRVFTFQSPLSWGFGTLEAQGKVALRPVRLSDGREFPVRSVDGLPSVDWTGLVKSREPEGFKPLRFTLDQDGYVSLNLFRADGSVARQLLTNAFYTKGEHEVRWDGLGTMSVRVPGQPLEPGDYTWGGITHPEITLSLRGWAASSSDTPWGNVWGADHGDPCAVASDGGQIYVGWGGGEGAKPLLACSPAGKIAWKQIRGGIASASLIAAADGTVYVWNEIGQYAPRSLYRVDARTGGYTEWESSKSTDLSMAQVFAGQKDVPDRPGSLAAGQGMLFLGFVERGLVAVVDAKTGKLLRTLAVPKVGDLELGADGLLYAISEGVKLVTIDPQGGAAKELCHVPLEDGKDWVSALAVGRDGDIYCGIRGTHHYVQVIGRDGKPGRTIGRKEGRQLTGPWQQDGMFAISALAIDGQGQLWATEEDGAPRRVSVWNAKTGEFANEFFGASTYGAIGGAINPLDPCLMIGQGCEWRIDPKTGRASVLGVITRQGMGATRFGFSPDHRLFAAITPGFLSSGAPIRFFEKLKDGDWKLRAQLSQDQKAKQVSAWADENGDGQQQSDEVRSWPDDLGGWVQGWYMAVTADLTCYGGMKQITVSGWTKCGAPRYDLSQAKPLPGPKDGGARGGMGAQHNAGAADNRFVLWNGTYGDDHATLDCYSLETGKLVWTYPSNFTGVHGSHRACAPEVGMLRGAYDICGSVTLPQPIGDIWVIPTNKGEWHAITEKGYYLTKFWEGDPMKAEFPAHAEPGADCTRCPPGAGEEAFGGSICLDKDGVLSLQGGHSSFWNVAVHGLERTRALAGGTLTLSAADVETARQYRQRYLNLEAGDRTLTVARATPAFTGVIDRDFAARTVKSFARQDNAKVRAALAWDEQHLYAAWEVMDDTPWINGADAPEFMYARGDTVDLQLQTDPKADPARDAAGLGDLRLSIGPFQGKATAVLYRRVVAKESDKHALKFVSGVYRDGVWMESVTFPTDLRIAVKPEPEKHRYVVEAAIPWATLGGAPAKGLVLRGDLGATHGNKAGDDTVLRSYWANLSTGLVSDEVEELMMTPKAWGELKLGE
jgi:hypothetical protein